jgi:dihydroorotate dehydrogenase electron transfer subunit
MVRLTVSAPGWRGADPGQFAILQAEPSRCFLGRALSISDEVGESVTFLVAPVGEGTRELSELAVNAAVWLLGPLGSGFDLDALVMSPGRAVIVAGGVGVAPFPLLLSRLALRYRGLLTAPPADQWDSRAAIGPEVLVLLGFRDSEQFQGSVPVREAVLRLGESGLRCRVEVAVEDGSRGPAEKVTDLLQRHVQRGDRVVACGPRAMMEAVWHVCRDVSDVEVWFSLETNMACGAGSCHGCVVTLAGGSYARVCHEGPVFAGREVFGD